MLKNPNYVYGARDLEVPIHLNFGEYMLEKLAKYKDNVCFINGATNESITYGTILQQSINFAVSLSRMRLKKGDVVGLLSENRNEYWSAVFGVAYTGAVVTTFSTSYVEGELKHVLNISKPKYIICSPVMYKKHAKTLHSQSFIKKIILFGDERLRNTVLFDEMIRTDVKLEEFEVVDVDGQTDTLFIIYSSGTTGLPKGVMLTHLNVIACCVLPATLNPSVKSFSISPWYHVMGLVGSITAIGTGRTGVYLPKFDVDTYLRIIETYKIPQLTVVPPVLVAVCKSPAKYDLSSVKYIYSGAAPLYQETINALKDTFPNLEVVMQGYGASEASLSITRVPFSERHEALGKQDSVGKVVHGSVMKVVNIETRIALGPNQQGEICFKGPNVMKGYVGIGKGDYFDKEGFYKTGDVGYYDPDGYLYIEDRLKELIKYKGYQVPPAEIEALLLTHPAVRDAGVIGIPDRNAGEVPLAFVAVQEGATVDADQLKLFVAERLSNPKHLRGGVRFVENIPKSVSGKILRTELRKIVKLGKSRL